MYFREISAYLFVLQAGKKLGFYIVELNLYLNYC